MTGAEDGSTLDGLVSEELFRSGADESPLPCSAAFAGIIAVVVPRVDFDDELKSVHEGDSWAM